MDGHSTHYCPETILSAKVIIFTLPPNTTHLSQPLDKGCFGPLKAHWRYVCHDFLTKNPGKVVTQFVFSELFAKAWMASMTMPNIISGFHHSSVYPVNHSKVIHQVEQISGSKSYEDTGIVYVPVLTPASHVKSSKKLDISILGKKSPSIMNAQFEAVMPSLIPSTASGYRCIDLCHFFIANCPHRMIVPLCIQLSKKNMVMVQSVEC